jgi:hypothetical protein
LIRGNKNGADEIGAVEVFRARLRDQYLRTSGASGGGA